MRILLLFIFLTAIRVHAQYSPPAGQDGTAAIHKDSSAFVAWATGCSVTRGYQDISDPGSGYASTGDESLAIGKSDISGVVSLGDGGSAVLTFAHPIVNGEGYDFAVFENSFDGLFLELAFVEVSSDGLNYFRFPASSLTDAFVQIGTFDNLDAEKINNLAGKYRAGYGTPFDLEELKDEPGLDVNHITHVRIVDVVGSIDDTYATYDADGNKINDPWPTPFAQSGFDLDAVGVINSTVASSVQKIRDTMFTIYPNPIQQGESIRIRSDLPFRILDIHFINATGMVLQEEEINSAQEIISTETLSEGVYTMRISDGENVFFKRLLIVK